MSDDYTVKIQECKVKATGDLSMRPSGTHFYKFYMNLPKYMSNALGLAGGERMYLSRTDDDVCALSRKWHGDSDIPVTLSESVTRRYNGRTVHHNQVCLAKGARKQPEGIQGKRGRAAPEGRPHPVMFF